MTTQNQFFFKLTEVKYRTLLRVAKMIFTLALPVLLTFFQGSSGECSDFTLNRCTLADQGNLFSTEDVPFSPQAVKKCQDICRDNQDCQYFHYSKVIMANKLHQNLEIIRVN